MLNLNFNLKTGWFTGLFEHQASTPGAMPTLVPITGIYIPAQNRGTGYFLLPNDNPNTTLESGSITILPHPTINPPWID
jgi:hypothetical protein